MGSEIAANKNPLHRTPLVRPICLEHGGPISPTQRPVKNWPINKRVLMNAN